MTFLHACVNHLFSDFLLALAQRFVEKLLLDTLLLGKLHYLGCWVYTLGQNENDRCELVTISEKIVHRAGWRNRKLSANFLSQILLHS